MIYLVQSIIVFAIIFALCHFILNINMKNIRNNIANDLKKIEEDTIKEVIRSTKEIAGRDISEDEARKIVEGWSLKIKSKHGIF